MAINPATFDSVLEKFLQRWPLERVQQMTLEDYVSIGNKDSFCYWLEYGTMDIGDVRGFGSRKFGVWQEKEDGLYLWSNEYLGTSYDSFDAAFKAVKDSVIRIITSSQTGNFDKIASIKFHFSIKWKIAFLYSGNKLMPIYSRLNLNMIARDISIPNHRFNMPIYKRHLGIASMKPEEETMGEYANRLLKTYIEGNGRNYYIINNYRSENPESAKARIKKMIDRETVAINFISDENLSDLFGKDIKEINNYVKDKHLTDVNEADRLQRNIGTFLNLKPKDLIAIISYGYNDQLVITAYAEVVERNGKIYFHDPNDLGQCINVKYMDIDQNTPPPILFGEFIWQVHPNRTKEYFFDFFAKYRTRFAGEEDGLDVLSTEIIYPTTRLYEEGMIKSMPVNKYERSTSARKACIKHYGTKCKVCDTDLSTVYGDIAKGYIHVHHKTPLSEIGQEYTVDPIEDLVPICPNCHSVLHLRNPILTIEELRAIIEKTKQQSG